MALVDSGADYPIFPMETAKEYLKLDLSDAEPWVFTGTTGEKQDAKLAETLMSVLDPDGNLLCEIHATCAFCETYKMSGGVLLGQAGFFSAFQITFRQRDRYFEIEELPEEIASCGLS